MKISYIPSLDGIRAVSVFIVLISHAGFGHIVPGGLGVTIFFFLSGYLITTLLLQEYETTQSISYPKFFVRRFFRLFPPLAACLAVTYSLPLFGFAESKYSLSGFMYLLFYLANYSYIFSWGGDIPAGLGILWSLAVEEHFYLIFPIFLFTCLKVQRRAHIQYTLIFICVLVLCWRCFLVYAVNAPELRTYYATDTRIDSILFGCILAIIKNPAKDIGGTKIPPTAMALLFGSAVLFLISLLYRQENFRESIRYSIQGIALMPIFYCCIKYNQNLLFSWLNTRWIKKIGVYSYCIYLIHFVILNALEYNGITNRLVLIGLTTLLSLTFAFTIDRFVDPYFLRLRKKFH